MAETDNTFKDVINTYVGHDEWEMGDDFANDIGLDSLECVELAMKIERAFNVHINEYDIEDLTTPQKMLDFVETRMSWKLNK